jgi:acetylornithine aminotransferase
LDVIQNEKLVENAEKVGQFIMEKLAELEGNFEIRGAGLMIGLEFGFPIKEIRQKLLFDYGIFTGVSGQNIIRLLPPLSLTIQQAEEFLAAFEAVFVEISALHDGD